MSRNFIQVLYGVQIGAMRKSMMARLGIISIKRANTLMCKHANVQTHYCANMLSQKRANTQTH